MTQEKVYFPNLDALRSFAFLLVYLRHGFGDLITPRDLGHPLLNLLKAGLFDAGDVGVSFFFVLSGFLITYLILKEIQLTGQIDVAAFYTRRCLRIWPLYYLVVGVALALLRFLPWARAGGYGEFPPAGYYLFFLANFAALGDYFIPTFLGVTWSIAIEEQFYLLWPQLFACLPRRAFKLIFPTVILLSVGFRVVHRNEPMVLGVHSFSVMSDLAMGGLIGYLALNSIRFLRWCENLKTSHIVLGYAVGFTAVLCRNYVYYPTTSEALMRVESLLIIFRRLMLSGFFAFIILEQNWARRSPLKFSRLSLVSAMGKYTYGLYLLHPMGLLLAAALLNQCGATLRELQITVACGVLGFPLSVVLSMVSYHAYEMPFLKLKKRFAHIASGSA